MPTVVVGYAYSDGPLSLVRLPLLNEMLYTLLLALKLVPVAVVALHLAPPPALCDSARFLHRLASSHRSARQQIGNFLATLPDGPLKAPLLAGAAVMLLAFSDFELAALLNGAAGKTASAFSWTIALHEAQQLRSPLSALAARAGAAAMCELAMVAGALGLLARSGGNATGAEPTCMRSAAAIHRSRRWACFVVVAIAAVILLLPGWVLLRGAVQGAGEFVAQFRLGDELAVSFYYASMCTGIVLACLAFAGARGARSTRQGARRRGLLILLSLPGALGGIVIAMLLLRLFSLPPLNALLDTPVPLVLGVSLLLLPPALLLRGLFDSASPATSAHLAHLLAGANDANQRSTGRAILWHLRGRSWLWLGAILFAVAYFELVICVTLAPIGMTPVIVGLYNQMHYGQRALLSAGVVVAMLIPSLVAALIAAIVRGVTRLPA